MLESCQNWATKIDKRIIGLLWGLVKKIKGHIQFCDFMIESMVLSSLGLGISLCGDKIPQLMAFSYQEDLPIPWDLVSERAMF